MTSASPWRKRVVTLATAGVVAGGVVTLAGCGTPAGAPAATSTRRAAASRAPAVSATAPAAGVTPAHAMAAPRRARSRVPAGVAAVVNGETVPLWEFQALLRLNAQTAGLAASSGASPQLAAVRARTARQIVDESLLNTYAQAHGLATPPTAVDAQLDVYRLQAGAGFAASLAHLGITRARFRRMVGRNLNAQAVTRHVVNAIAAPPVSVQVVQVVVPSWAQAQHVRDELVRSADAMGANAMLVAAQQSSDPYIRRLAGQLPPLTRARGEALFGPRWGKTAFTLPPGAISAPVHLSDGWAVMQVIEREPATALMEGTLSRFIDTLRRAARITSYVG